MVQAMISRTEPVRGVGRPANGPGPCRVSVIIPVYNERATLPILLERVRRVALPLEIIVVDDGSTDGTRELLLDLKERMPEIKLHLHDQNRGKGAAVRTGLAHATGEIVLTQDADLEYDPRDYPAIVAPLAAGEAKVVYGSRSLADNPFGHRLFYWGGQFVTFVTNLLYGSNLTDEPTGYKAFLRPVVQGLDLESDGFEFCPEVTGKLLRRGYAIHEVPISYNPRSRAEGKKIKARDGLMAIWTLVKFRLLPPAGQRVVLPALAPAALRGLRRKGVATG